MVLLVLTFCVSPAAEVGCGCVAWLVLMMWHVFRNLVWVSLMAFGGRPMPSFESEGSVVLLGVAEVN